MATLTTSRHLRPTRFTRKRRALPGLFNHWTPIYSPIRQHYPSPPLIIEGCRAQLSVTCLHMLHAQKRPMVLHWSNQLPEYATIRLTPHPHYTPFRARPTTLGFNPAIYIFQAGSLCVWFTTFAHPYCLYTPLATNNNYYCQSALGCRIFRRLSSGLAQRSVWLLLAGHTALRFHCLAVCYHSFHLHCCHQCLPTPTTPSSHTNHYTPSLVNYY